MRNLLVVVLGAAALFAAAPTWLDRVAPVITPAEKKLYLSLSAAERERFEQRFWADKAVTAAEYFQRIEYIDNHFGSGRAGSGVNTDQGRVYLSLGPPNRVTHLPSSRIFVPMEIWYYDNVPAIHLTTELRLIFFQRNNVGFLKLYSPTLDTIRALLLPEAATDGMFGSNDDITEADIRGNMTVPGAEDEVISAAVNVATGVKYSGNDQVLGQITSPMFMLRTPPDTEVRSRLIASHPKLDLLETKSPYGGSQVDLGIETSAQKEIDLQVLAGSVTVYQNQLLLKFSETRPVRYTHRLDLLPGTYRIFFTVDGTVHPYSIEVADPRDMGQILRADPGDGVARRNQTPFEFEGRRLDLNPEGKVAAVLLPQPEKVNWTIRNGLEVLWRYTSDAQQMSMIELPLSGFPAGTYKLEADSDSGSRSTEFVVKDEKRAADPKTPDTMLVSFNANLRPALRLALIGRQWLLRGKLDEATHALQASLAIAPTREASIEMARVDAALGRYDEARDSLRPILKNQPQDFDALSILAYVEANLQDYEIAAELYRRALAVQDSPVLRLALDKLPRQ